MKVSGQFRSIILSPQVLGRVRFQRVLLTVAVFFTLGIVCSAAPGLALAQGPPAEWAQNEHSSGFSPSGDDSEGETPVTVTGVLTIIHGDDFTNKRSKSFYHLKDRKTHKAYKLHFSKKPPAHLRTGSTVTVRGRARGQDLFLGVDQAGEESIETVLPAAAAVAGEQRAIVMVVNFLDASVSCAVGSIEDLMFTDPNDNSVDDLYQETSFGNVWFTGDVVGPYTIDYMSAGTCEYSGWGQAADAAALADGVDLNAYNRKVYVLPVESACNWAGLATVGGNPSRTWILRCGMEDVFAHELGHNLRMHHSSTPTSEYGDTSDIMGYAGYGLRHVNAPHHEQMGWLPAGQIVEVTAAGLYDVAPLELDGAEAMAPQVLKLAKPDTDEYYYLSYRQPLGFDVNVPSKYLTGLNVHRYRGDGSASRTYFLDALADGETFVDAINGFSVTQMSRNNEYLTVQVEFDGADPTCTPAAPTVNVSPSSQSADPGARLDYTITVTNTDSAECDVSIFSLDSSLPTGWAGGVSPSGLTLLPGETGRATLSVTSPGGAAAGGYGLNVMVSEGAVPTHTASGSASYMVQAACSPQSPTVSLSPASQSGDPGATLSYMVTVTNRDSSGCGQSELTLSPSLPSGWAGNLNHNSLTLSPGQTGTATLSVTSPDTAAAGAYSLRVAAADLVHAGSGSGSYVVQVVEDDTQPPTVPTGLSAKVKGKQVNLSWRAATDNLGVRGYTVWRNGAQIRDVTATTWADKTVSPGVTYTYSISAHDAAGNVSAPSTPVVVTVKNGGGGGKGKPKK